MVARWILAFMLVLSSCAGSDQYADVSWLINDSTDEVMGVVGRSSSDASSFANRFVLMECASYDLFATASVDYAQDDDLPQGCDLLVDEELTKDNLHRSKEEVTKKLQKEKLIGGLLDNLTSGLNSGAILSMVGISSKNVQAIADVISRVRDLDILPNFPRGKVKKGFMILSTLALIVTSSGILKRQGDDSYQIVLDELAGAEYIHRLQDQEVSRHDYQEIRQMLTDLIENKVKHKPAQEIKTAIAN